jgi:hypothetical protein
MALNAHPPWDWIAWRHRIHVRKQAGDRQPGTADEDMQTHHFCNIFRKLDQVTVWPPENRRDPHEGGDNVWIAMGLRDRRP